MTNPSHAPTLSDKIWSLFISVKFTVLLLVTWLLGSVAGTLIVQNAPPAQYVEMYGTTWSNIMLRLGLFDTYHATWYSLILLLLMLNIIACTLNSYAGKKALAYIQPKRKWVTGSGKKYLNREYPVTLDEAGIEKLEAALNKKINTCEKMEEGSGVKLYAQKQPFSHFMVYIVHASLVIIIIGGMVSALFGFEGVMEIPDGKSRDFVFKKSATGYVMSPVPFAVKLDSFDLQRFPNGMPKDYVSVLHVIDNGQVTLKKRIEVNDPLSYGDYIFYQSTYVEQAPLIIKDSMTGRTYDVPLATGRQHVLEDIKIGLHLERFASTENGLSAHVVAVNMDGSTQRVILFANSDSNELRPINDRLSVGFGKLEPTYISGLMVVADPGVGFIWLGSFLLVLGLYLTFYTSHRQVAILVGNNSIELHGYASKNMPAFKRLVDKIEHESGLKEYKKG